MGFRGLGFSLLIIFIYICSFASSSSNHKNLPKEFMHISKIEERAMYGSKIEAGGVGQGGMGGGRGPGNGENSNNGGSGSSSAQTGAANNNHHHQNRHGGCNRNLSIIQFPTLLMIIIISTLTQFFC